MPKKYDVVIAGDIFCDLIFTGLPHMPATGEEIYSTDFDMTAGGIFITAATLRRLGMDVGLFCHLGTDPFSRFILQQMEEENLDLSHVQMLDRPMRTISVALSLGGDRSFVSFTDPRPGDPSPPEALSGAEFRHIHIHWLGQLWDHPGLIDIANRQHASISLDSQCCPDVMAREDVPEKLNLVDVFMPNRIEALQIARVEDPEEALSVLASWAPSVTNIVKLGAEGAIACHEGRRYSFPALPINAIDTTGAGDAFAGGYIFGLLSGMSFEDRMRAATICGGLSASARGGATRVPRLTELREWMSRDWKEPVR